MDIRLRFKKPEKAYTDRTCVIIVCFAGISIGLIVDSVSEVLTIPDEDIAEKPEINSKGSRGYIKNIGKIGDESRCFSIVTCCSTRKSFLPYPQDVTY
jgi:purine-binding chemotaxis protein CheW